jgi:transketolase
MTARLTSAMIDDARRRLIRMHYEARVGHLGGNLSCLDALMVAFHEFVGEDDRFILSKGHSAGALYVALWSRGLIDDAELATFHRDGTRLAGHPPARAFPEIAFATGSLGHGLSLASGTALGLRLRGAPGRVICLTSDGEWQEGSTWEALIFACHRRLSNLTVLVDHNGLQGFGSTHDVASMAPLWERLSGFDVDTEVVDGHDHDAIRAALGASGDRVRLIFLRTTKGRGIAALENRMESHYLPLTEAQYAAARDGLGMPS